MIGVKGGVKEGKEGVSELKVERGVVMGGDGGE